MVAVVGAVEQGDTPVLRRMHHHAGTAVALALDVDAWVGQPTTGGAAATLTRLGVARRGTRPARPPRRRVAGARPLQRPRLAASIADVTVEGVLR